MKKDDKIEKYYLLYRTYLWLVRVYKDSLINLVSFFLVIFFTIAVTILEAISFTMFIPIIEFIKSNSQEGFVPESKISILIYELFSYFNLNINLLRLSIVMFILVSFRQIFTYFQIYYSAKVRWQSFYLFSKKIFSRFVKTKIEILDHLQLAKFSSIMHDDLKKNCALITIVLLYFQTFIMFLAYACVLLYNSPISAIAAMSLLIIVSLIYYPIIKKAKTKSAINMELRYGYINSLNQFHRSLKETKIYMNYVEVKKIFKNTTNKYSISYLTVAKLSAKLDLLFIPTVFVFLLVIINFLYTSSNLELESIILLVAALLRLVPLGRSFSKAMNTFAQIEPSLERTYYTLVELEKHNETQPIKFKRKIKSFFPKKNISFKNVYFTYKENGREVFKNFSASIPIGKITVITGKSGSGKSTLVDLLTRFRDVDNGHIFFDNRDISKVSPDSVRSYISYLPQTPFIFEGSIKENILFGNLESNIGKVKLVSSEAGMSNFIDSLAEGYETVCGEMGMRFSGGQRQRIGLARALIADKPLLILDEPSSALDGESEKIIRKNLLKLKKNKKCTIIIIAHREGIISIADKIIEIKNHK